jgi:RNA polymerase sigma factor (TIGR02999 family)
VDWARSRQYRKRRGEAVKVCLDESLATVPERCRDLVALDDALRDLGAVDPRKSQIVELRFFGGLSVEETASVLRISPRTVMREWSYAQAWLYKEVTSGK